jgi:hypothetical protein
MENELVGGSMDTSWSLETLEAMAKEHGGKAIRIVSDSPLITVLWECFKGHRWDQKPEIILRGDWCPFCERVKRKNRENPKTVKNVTVQQIFNGERFELFAFDMNNLATGWCKTHSKDDILYSDFAERILRLLPKSTNYLCYFFASNYFEHLKRKFPADFQNRWYIENFQKNGIAGECMDIDSTLTGRISSILELYRDQITHFHLGSGDLDLHYVVDVARLHKIPVTAIAFDGDSLNSNLKNMSDSVQFLY